MISSPGRSETKHCRMKELKQIVQLKLQEIWVGPTK